jgi:ferredoxin
MYTEMRIQSLYFSPTGTTRKTVSAIEEHTSLHSLSPIDLTLPKPRESFTGKIEGDVILIGVPVYHGTMPLPMMEPLERLEGKGKWAVPMAVYGNRSPESCVEELAKVLRDKGFKILAAASFVAEHSMATKDHPWGLGRPDQSDLDTAAKFGERIKEKLYSGPSEIETSDRFLNFLTKETVESFPQGYHRKLADLIKAVVGIVFSKDVVCTDCMSCSNVCPTGAIKVDSKEIDDALCIRCAACVRACPEGAVRFHWMPVSSAMLERVDKLCAVRKEPKLYL